jgi:hypothetical protein
MPAPTSTSSEMCSENCKGGHGAHASLGWYVCFLGMALMPRWVGKTDVFVKWEFLYRRGLATRSPFFKLLRVSCGCIVNLLKTMAMGTRYFGTPSYSIWGRGKRSEHSRSVAIESPFWEGRMPLPPPATIKSFNDGS